MFVVALQRYSIDWKYRKLQCPKSMAPKTKRMKNQQLEYLFPAKCFPWQQEAAVILQAVAEKAEREEDITGDLFLTLTHPRP
jgi:hypothetical protein